jgi:hypothetical protein
VGEAPDLGDALVHMGGEASNMIGVMGPQPHGKLLAVDGDAENAGLHGPFRSLTVFRGEASKKLVVVFELTLVVKGVVFHPIFIFF